MAGKKEDEVELNPQSIRDYPNIGLEDLSADPDHSWLKVYKSWHKDSPFIAELQNPPIVGANLDYKSQYSRLIKENNE